MLVGSLLSFAACESAPGYTTGSVGVDVETGEVYVSLAMPDEPPCPALSGNISVDINGRSPDEIELGGQALT